MNDFLNKNVLICIGIKSTRALLFNYLDSKDCGTIYSAKDIQGSKKILATERIDYLLIEYSREFIRGHTSLNELIEAYSGLKVVIVIKSGSPLKDIDYQQFVQIAEVVLFEPFTTLEFSIKLNNSNTKQLQVVNLSAQTNNSDNNNSEKLEGLWNILFEDSLQAKLIVDADTHKIIRANQALLELMNQTKLEVIDQPWTIFDDPINHDKYASYLKEISLNEITRFVIKNKQTHKVQNLKANFQMGVQDGEIVYSGFIIPDVAQGVSNEVYQHLQSISSIDISPEPLTSLLDEIRVSLNLKFLMFLECQNEELLKPIAAGDENSIQRYLNNSLTSLVALLKTNKKLEIDRQNSRTSIYMKILDTNSLQSFCLYPIAHQGNVYGAIIGGGLSQVDSWQTTSVLLNGLANHCRFSIFQKNIAEQREVEGLKDALTGLPNRNSMTKMFAKIIEAGISSEKYISLMIIDINKINFLNKSIGIELTSQFIVSISQIIVKCVRSKGQVYRLSGGEFLVLLKPYDNKKLVNSIAEDLVRKFNRPILLSNGEDANIDFNIGISVFPDDGQTVSSMMKNADLAMYDAKLKGNKNYVVFKHFETGQALKQRTEMEENLRTAIEKEHIKVFFQPKINALTEDIVGFEALARWIDPEIGMINPGHFIPLAEETGLINEIGDYVTKHSCQMLFKWHKQYGLELSCSINLSVVQLKDAELATKLEDIINSTGIHPQFIDFEITETMNLDDVPNLVHSLNEIVAIGCTLSIDDFGTGHSSLDYVKKIPAKHIKIDQSFVRNIGFNPEDEAILDATIGIAKRLNRELVAEGVETEEQREYLLERDCDYFQGFLFSRPLPEEDIERLLEQRVKLMGYG